MLKKKKKKALKVGFHPTSLSLINYCHHQQCTAKSTAQAQDGGFLAGTTPKRPHHPPATDLVGMKDPDNKPQLTQNGGHWHLAERAGFPLAMCEIDIADWFLAKLTDSSKIGEG